MERFKEECDRESAAIGQGLAANCIDSEACEACCPLANDETERLIALCEAPALLWHHEPAPARAPEPFGMIA
jgi:hypothetical protein